MNRKKLSIAALALYLAACSFSLSAKGKKVNYNRSVFYTYESLPVNTRDAERTKKLVSAKFPGWAFSAEKLSGSFDDIYGTPVELPGNSPVEKAQSCMSQQLASLGVSKAEWKQVSNVDAPKAHYVNYTRIVDGHPVVFSWLSFRFSKNGNLARIQMKHYGNPSGNQTPVLSVADAKKAAIKDLDGVAITTNDIDAEWSWFPIPRAGGYELHPAWHFKVSGKAAGSVPLKLTGYVDAVDGTLLYRTNDVKETGYDLTVKGMVYRDGTLNPATLEALPDLGLDIAAGTYYTDATGLFSSASLVLPLSTTVPLAGLWSTVIDSVSGLTPSFTELVTLPGSTYTYPVTAPSSSRTVNAYYHVNRVHNFMKGYYPTFTGMDFSLPTNVDVSGSCNAFYDGSSINFYQAGGGCNSFAEIGDIIYHEYGHGISDHFYTDISGTSITNGALNEANSDIWALSITRDPVLAKNSFTGFGGFIRRYDMTPQVYPIDLAGGFFGDPHKNGQIIAGAWWDVGVNIGSVDSMTKLFTDVYYDVPDGPDGTEGAVYQSILVDALMADDNNGNLLDGTPHYQQIVAAFARHGIYLEKTTTLGHAEPGIQPAGTPIPITATLTMGTATYFHDMTLYYRVNGTGSWTPIALTASGSTYSASIPAQTDGATVEYYFMIHDGLGNPNAFFPITCNPAMPSFQTTIPYQFAVGVHNVEGSDFESAIPGWGVSGNAGDDATDGLWQQAVPVAATFGTSAWPAQDHTIGVGKTKCLITGNSSGFSGTSVTDGTATVQTPVFDISGYAAPVVEYYRWFSNEQGDNFKNDPWIVKVGDGSGTWQTVEQTYQPELKWRRRTFPVSAYLPSGTAHLQLKFFASDSLIANWDNNGQSTTVGGIDDFFLYDKDATAAVGSTPVVKSEIYPNPANDKINIILQGSMEGAIDLYDMLGKKVMEVPVTRSANTYELHTKSLVPGMYTVVIRADKSIQSKNVVVAHP